MSLLTLAAGILIPGVGIGGAVAKWGAKLVFGKIGSGLKTAGGFIAANWKPLAVIASIGAAVIYVLILRGDIRELNKELAADKTTIAAVKVEVDRGVGKATPAADAPAYIRGFVDNLATVKAALDRQSAALKVAQQAATAHVEAAHQAAQPTPSQQQRDKDRQKIADPARTTGLTADEWSKL